MTVIEQSPLIQLAERTETLAAQARRAGQLGHAEELERQADSYRRQEVAKCQAALYEQRECFAAFDERHGAGVKDLSVSYKGWLLWPDGARASAGNPEDRYEPPTNDYQRLLVQRDYHQTALARWELNFRETKTEFANQQSLALRFHGAVPEFDADYVRKVLQDLAASVTRHRQALAKIITALERTPEVQEQRQQQANRQDNENRRALAMAAIQSVHI
jgi:hypothetical protein